MDRHQRHDHDGRRHDIRDDGIRVDHTNVGLRAVRSDFGGLDLPATLAGLAAALGLAVLLGGLLSALGAYGVQSDAADGADRTALGIGALAAGGVTLLLSFLFGGWVAGRMARYDGGRNGLTTAVWFLLLTTGLTALAAWAGDRFDVLGRSNIVPSLGDLDAGDARNLALAATIVTAGLTLLAGWLGGRIGERYHLRADHRLVDTRPGGVVDLTPANDVPRRTTSTRPLKAGRR